MFRFLFIFLIFNLLQAQEIETVSPEKISSEKIKKNIPLKDKKKNKLSKKTKPSEIKNPNESIIIPDKKSQWVHSEFLKNTNYIPGLENTQEEVKPAEIKKSNTVGVTNPPVEVKTLGNKPDNKKPNPLYIFFSDNIKIVLIIAAIILFALYRIRFNSSRSQDKSDRVYSKFRNKN